MINDLRSVPPPPLTMAPSKSTIQGAAERVWSLLRNDGVEESSQDPSPNRGLGLVTSGFRTWDSSSRDVGINFTVWNVPPENTMAAGGLEALEWASDKSLVGQGKAAAVSGLFLRSSGTPPGMMMLLAMRHPCWLPGPMVNASSAQICCRLTEPSQRRASTETRVANEV